MLKKFLKPSIIVLTQCGFLLLLIVYLAPVLLNHTASLTRFVKTLHHFKGTLLVIHGLFYGVLYVSWPWFIHLISQKNADLPDKAQQQLALNARIYLIGIFIIFELLGLLR